MMFPIIADKGYRSFEKVSTIVTKIEILKKKVKPRTGRILRQTSVLLINTAVIVCAVIRGGKLIFP